MADTVAELFRAGIAIIILIVIVSAFYNMPGSIGATFRTVTNEIIIGIIIVVGVTITLWFLLKIHDSS